MAEKRTSVGQMKFDYPKNVHFKCLRCALCCGDTKNRERAILLMKIEAEYIVQKTSKSLKDFAEKIRGYQPYVYRMKKTADGKCVFLNGNSCTIYSIRPLICRFYPFQLESFGNNRYAFTYTEECPSIGKGPELEKKYFAKLLTKIEETMKKSLHNV
jgi:Fe-S-cluster containining protein